MSVYKRPLKKGYSWRAVVRIEGFPPICKTCKRKEEAEDWEQDTKRQIKRGEFKFDQYRKRHTFSELIESFISNGSLQHHRSYKDTLRHLEYWKTRLGKYALVHLTSELIGKERLLLLEKPTPKGTKCTPSTVNRYLASLSSLFSYAVKELKWLSESPCLHLKKLKENPGRDRFLTYEEISRLLIASKQSKNLYLYCIVLIAITTGARQGEILNLEWRYIDFENGLAYIKETKNGRPRSVPFVPQLLEELKRLQLASDPRKALVFASRTAFGKIDIKKSWQEALKRSGIDNFRFHDLRHSYTTNAAKEGASNMELQTATGHRTTEMLTRYTHLDPLITRKYSKAICDKIFGVQNET
ncbi:MAG: hypothetical protein A3F09_03495 [Chlamydiae bacterium RIFCSPHIGHO2_12_FULL_49_11]|nr:MAG: hypothetical protein A3F09_03495 [Chlamydiae bacterium RIFCSPHIGHO2_12_FULL_49_11]